MAVFWGDVFLGALFGSPRRGRLLEGAKAAGQQAGLRQAAAPAGGGFSFNPFVWHEDIDPRAGVLRLVFGLGTRAAERTEDDYTRLVALNAPQNRPESEPDAVRPFSRRRVDLLDLNANQLSSRLFEVVAKSVPSGLLSLFATAVDTASGRLRDRHQTTSTLSVVTFDRLLATADFVPTMRELLQVLEEAYNCPVDIEFIGNFASDGRFRINLVQCRPFSGQDQGRGQPGAVARGGGAGPRRVLGACRRPAGQRTQPRALRARPGGDWARRRWPMGRKSAAVTALISQITGLFPQKIEKRD
jgi:hypothetical protein